MKCFRTGLLALALSASPALAQMYKCVGADGKASYRDRPCDTGAKQADVEGAMTGRLPQVRHYDVKSRDWANLMLEMQQQYVKTGFHGLANWKVGYNARWTRNADGSCTSSVAPTFAGEILMPRWSPGPNVSADQKKAWDRYYAALKVHEDGHISHGKQLASA